MERVAVRTQLAAPTRSTLSSEAERHARRLGLPLATAEVLRAHPKLARDFLRAVRENRARRFVDSLDVDAFSRELVQRDAEPRRFALAGLFLF